MCNCIDMLEVSGLAHWKLVTDVSANLRLLPDKPGVYALRVCRRGKHYGDEFAQRWHSALEYLRPVDYYLGNPQALLAKRKTKLREAAARRKEVNRAKKEIRLMNEAPEMGHVNEGPKR